VGGANNQLNCVGVTATAAKNRLICKQPIAAQYFGLYADPADIGKNAVWRRPNRPHALQAMTACKTILAH